MGKPFGSDAIRQAADAEEQEAATKAVEVGTLFHPDDEALSRSGRMAMECLDTDEPFFVLRAKDMFSVMAVHNYQKLVDEYGPLDTEFHMRVADAAAEMRKWQMGHPERVKYPD